MARAYRSQADVLKAKQKSGKSLGGTLSAKGAIRAIRIGSSKLGCSKSQKERSLGAAPLMPGTDPTSRRLLLSNDESFSRTLSERRPASFRAASIDDKPRQASNLDRQKTYSCAD